MSGKGSNRRPTNEAAYVFGWDRIFGKKLLGSSSTVEQATLTGSAAGSNPASPAIFNADPFERQMEAAISADPGLMDKLKADVVYVDDATGKMVDEDYWP